jgi:Leucine-rich repeat (LRR) protein
MPPHLWLRTQRPFGHVENAQLSENATLKGRLQTRNLSFSSSFSFLSSPGKSLRELDLSMNSLSSLPCALLLRCPKLEQLSATYNSIEGLSDELPLLPLARLYSVDLSQNKLTAFGQLRFMHNLTALNVEGNELKQIPPELSQLKNLKFLAIGQNPQR